MCRVETLFELGEMTNCTKYPVVIAAEDDENIRRSESLGALFETFHIEGTGPIPTKKNSKIL
jgi:hypothetical protein